MLRWAFCRFLPRLKRTSQKWRADDGSLLAAAVSYYACLSLFPLLLVLLSALGLIFRFSGWGQDTHTRLMELISAETSQRLARQVGGLLTEVQSKALVGGPIGAISLLLLALALFIKFERAFDRIWGKRSRPKGLLPAAKRVLLRRLRAFLMLLSLGLVVLASFVVNVTVSAVRSALWDFPGSMAAWQMTHLLASFLLNCAVFTLLYRTLPKTSVPWWGAFQGGVLVAVSWEAGRLVLSAFLIIDKWSAYGIVGGFIAILLWTYYASTIVLFGAEYVSVACADFGLLDEQPEEPPKGGD